MQALNIAYGGMMNAMQAFEVSAAKTVRASVALTQSVTADAPVSDTTDGDFITQTVDQINSRNALSANVAVAKTADEMLGRLLDIKA
jgi:hypothetical protein